MMSMLEKKKGEEPLKIFDQAIQNVRPVLEVKAKRVGGSTFQVPYNVERQRGLVLAMRWILIAARNRAGKNTAFKLTNEILDAFNKSGSAMKKRNDINRMAESNKAF